MLAISFPFARNFSFFFILCGIEPIASSFVNIGYPLEYKQNMLSIILCHNESLSLSNLHNHLPAKKIYSK